MDGESLEEHDAMMMTPLSAMAEAFEELDKVLRSREDDRQLRLDTFCEACSLVSVLFGCLGFAFKFAEVDYVSKVHIFSLMDSPDSGCCWNVCSSYKKPTSAEAQ